ncbi:MAG: ankyrin repeat domain-containing protein [Elusimicrobium sp.]|nr:ankyrin repeat domain-containing protein [Elusimicrobium sp.]
MKKTIFVIFLAVFYFYGCNENKEAKNAKLLTAAKECNTAVVEAALKAGADPNTKVYDVSGKENLGPVIMIAVWPCKNEKMVDLLLTAGADINGKSDIGGAALNMASGENMPDSIIKKLIAKGANVNSTYNEGMNALLDALITDNITALKILLDAGANPNVQNIRTGETPLTVAAGLLKIKPHSREAINLFLAAGADARVKNKKGKTASMLAQERGYSDIAAILKKAEQSKK